MPALTIDQRNAAFGAVKTQLTKIIDDKAGIFASTIEGKMTDADILSVSDAGLEAALSVPPATPVAPQGD
jgi:hypothetical protein